jgi:hypothetical protein
MSEAKTENVKKKGILAAIWESMTKTGGCCGSGGNCCGPAQPEPARKQSGKEPATPSSLSGR